MSQQQADAQNQADAAERAAAWAAFGAAIEEDEDASSEMEEFYLLPESVPVFQLWQDVQTQWRSGMGGPTGMDYSAVEAYMRMSHNPLRRDPTTISLLRGMEREALNAYAERRASESRA